MLIETGYRETYSIRGDCPWFKVHYFSADNGGDICHTKSRQGAPTKGEVGYLKVGYTDVKIAREMFKTPYHFGVLTKGYCCQPEELAEQLHRYSTTFEQLKKDMHRYLRTAKDFFFVDYIQVAPEFKRKGIGTQLYTTAAKWLAENEGQMLYGSSIQSDPAKAAWASMVAKGLPIRKSKKNKDGVGYRLCMDMR